MSRPARIMRRASASLLLPLSVLPLLLVIPTLVSAYQNFDRRHRSDPLPAPAVVLTAAEIARWQPLAANRLIGVPVLAYHGINDERDQYSVSRVAFARQLAMLRQAGFRALSITQYVRALRGDHRGLPDRPILITFDDGRLDSYRGADRILQRYGMRATMFVIAGVVQRRSPFYLSWKELQGMQSSGRWDIQEHAGSGHRPVTYDRAGHAGPFYAFRRYTRSAGLETLADWEQRATGDIFAGRDALRDHIRGFKPLTFAVPYGNYGQRDSNDPRIAGLLGDFLHRQFETVFVQRTGNDPAFTTPLAHHGDAERYEVHTATTADSLYRWLHDHSSGWLTAMLAGKGGS